MEQVKVNVKDISLSLIRDIISSMNESDSRVIIKSFMDFMNENIKFRSCINWEFKKDDKSPNFEMVFSHNSSKPNNEIIQSGNRYKIDMNKRIQEDLNNVIKARAENTKQTIVKPTENITKPTKDENLTTKNQLLREESKKSIQKNEKTSTKSEVIEEKATELANSFLDDMFKSMEDFKISSFSYDFKNTNTIKPEEVITSIVKLEKEITLPATETNIKKESVVKKENIKSITKPNKPKKEKLMIKSKHEEKEIKESSWDDDDYEPPVIEESKEKLSFGKTATNALSMLNSIDPTNFIDDPEIAEEIAIQNSLITKRIEDSKDYDRYIFLLRKKATDLTAAEEKFIKDTQEEYRIGKIMPEENVKKGIKKINSKPEITVNETKKTELGKISKLKPSREVTTFRTAARASTVTWELDEEPASNDMVTLRNSLTGVITNRNISRGHIIKDGIIWSLGEENLTYVVDLDQDRIYLYKGKEPYKTDKNNFESSKAIRNAYDSLKS